MNETEKLVQILYQFSICEKCNYLALEGGGGGGVGGGEGGSDQYTASEKFGPRNILNRPPLPPPLPSPPHYSKPSYAYVVRIKMTALYVD